MAKQLNVRSDKAYTTARRIAKRLSKTTREVVVEALHHCERKAVKVPSYEDLNAEQKRFADRLLALARAGRAEGNPHASSDHRELYDEYGAPR